MKLREILDRLEPAELERLASDKVHSSDHVRLPLSILLSELESVLRSFSYVQRALAERHPPTFATLSLLLEAEGNELPISALRARVEEETQALCDRAARDEGLLPEKQYALYRRILAEAWKSDLVIEASEANLLAALRRELSITYREHMFLAHHPELQPFWRSERAFERERNALMSAGILFAVEERYVIPIEIAPMVRAAWDIQLSTAAMRRLCEEISITDLADSLRALRLPSSGTKEEKIGTLVSSLVSPREMLQTLNLVTTLRNVARRVGCSASGTKDELVERLLEHFEKDLDLAHATQAEPPEPAGPKAAPEPKALEETAFRHLFSRLTNEELYEVLAGCEDLRLSGSKDVRIASLWNSPYSEASLLGRLTNRTLAGLLERCALKTSGPKDEKVQRLIDSSSGFRAQLPTERAPVSEAVEREDLAVQPTAPQPAPPAPARLGELLTRFPFLDREQAVVLALLQEFQSLTDLELERLAARHDLQWYFLREEMRRLAAAMREHGAPVIEHREAAEHDIYLYRATP